MRTSTLTMASSRSRWMKPPNVWLLTIPISHSKASKTVIVQSMLPPHVAELFGRHKCLGNARASGGGGGCVWNSHAGGDFTEADAESFYNSPSLYGGRSSF